MSKYRQVVLFGSPGTGKSRMVRTEMLPELGIDPESENCEQAVFHPEYSYGDFMGKLMPLTKDGDVRYDYYEGSFLSALSKAYKNILQDDSGEPDNVALVIDEINRGNSAAIFGTVFQLLDRKRKGEIEGWSEYLAGVSNMEFSRLMELIGISTGTKRIRGVKKTVYQYRGNEYVEDDINYLLEDNLNIRKNKIRIPANLSIIATMNTSDKSIYHMDAAFKRRWSWKYVDVDATLKSKTGNAFETREEWESFVDNLNNFIMDNEQYIRDVEDRLIGYWFIGKEEGPITLAEVQNKLMFFIWDSIFETNRNPISDILSSGNGKMLTFGQFSDEVEEFIYAVQNR